MAKMRKTPRARAYRVVRSAAGDVSCEVLREGARPRQLPHVAVHSPTGFEVGYGGSGPADLALSIVADLLDASRSKSAYRCPSGRDADAWLLYQPFKWRFLAGLDVGRGRSAELDAAELHAWIVKELQARTVGAA
jgi:hypothetical protein